MLSKVDQKLGIPVALLFCLALLGVPRVIAHDLRWVEPGSLVNSLLAIIPPVIWLMVVLWKKQVNAFQALLLVGIFYGFLLALTHQIFWHITFDTPPTLGGNFANFPSFIGQLIPRIFGFFSSLFTGAVIGLLLGGVGFIVNKVRSK